jgi:RNA polymerase sigma-70 factor, ECF subfamily
MISAVTTAIDEAAAASRPRLLALAYRMIGSMSDAEDVVQDAILKARKAPPEDLDSPVAYLTTVTTRTAIDHLRSARVRRESYVGPWLPEPILDDPAADVADHAVLSESLSMAFLVVLENLAPEERAALLLHDVFGYSHAEVAAILRRTENSSRQLLFRARQRVEAERPRFDVDAARRDEVVASFKAACEGADFDAFLRLLTDDAVLVSDGGAKARAARHPVRGAVRIARFLSHTLRPGRGQRQHRVITVNGAPALALLDGGRLTSLFFVEPDANDRIGAVRIVRNPDKLQHVRAAVEES